MSAENAQADRLYGLAAEFATADALLVAARRAREAGYRQLDAHTPFPVDGLAEAVGFRDRRLPRLMLAGGVIGAAAGFGLQVAANLDYPLNVGGRPLIAPQAFAMITIELTILVAVLFIIGGMFLLNRLPRLHHPIFNLARFHLATRDRFFLVVSATDDRFDEQRTRAFLESLEPARVDAVCDTMAGAP